MLVGEHLADETAPDLDVERSVERDRPGSVLAAVL
jgi:hypothetical protein